MLEMAILDVVAVTPSKAADVRARLVRDGWNEGEVRSAIAKLWDEGRLNVGGDLVLRIPEI